MNRLISIELFEEHDAMNFYSLQYEGEDMEAEKFFDKFPEGCNFDDDIDIIVSWLDTIGEKGALERYFRPEGKLKDNVSAIPIESSKLRLYCLRISDQIVILGNGGRKETATYNEDPLLNCYVSVLQLIDQMLRRNISSGETSLYGKQIYDKVKFRTSLYCDEEE